MYYGGGDQTIVNNNSFPLTSDFVSLHLKGRNDSFALKGGDATKGPLVTTYDGPRPDPKLACCVRPPWSYQPMQKQGAIILGTGGDNSNGAEGNFYEGALCCCAHTVPVTEFVPRFVIMCRNVFVSEFDRNFVFLCRTARFVILCRNVFVSEFDRSFVFLCCTVLVTMNGFPSYLRTHGTYCTSFESVLARSVPCNYHYPISMVKLVH